MGVTAAQFKKALQSCGAYGGQPWTMTQLANGANDAAKVMGITTRSGLAILIANCMIESGWYRTTTEYTSQYTPRYDPYRGRTFTQNTFEAGYRLVGRYAKREGMLTDSEYFVKNPVRLGDYKWAWIGPAAYYTANGLVARCNRGGLGELKAVGRIIHAGAGRSASSYPKYAMERDRQNNIIRAYNALMAAGITKPGPAVFRYHPPKGGWVTRRIQRNVFVNDDGVYGPGTRDAVKKAQRKLGFTDKAVDGLWGPSTEKAMIAAQKKGTYPRPDRSTQKPKQAKPKPATPSAPKFPLPSGHWYGPQSSNPRNHSGYYAKDRPGIRRWQTRMRKRGWKITPDGRFGPASAKVARQFQREKRLGVDGLVGRATWNAAWNAKVT